MLLCFNYRFFRQKINIKKIYLSKKIAYDKQVL